MTKRIFSLFLLICVLLGLFCIIGCNAVNEEETDVIPNKELIDSLPEE